MTVDPLIWASVFILLVSVIALIVWCAVAINVEASLNDPGIGGEDDDDDEDDGPEAA